MQSHWSELEELDESGSWNAKLQFGIRTQKSSTRVGMNLKSRAMVQLSLVRKPKTAKKNIYFL